MPRTALLLVPLALSAACATPHLDAMGRYGQYSLDGDLAISTTGASARNDLDALGLDDKEGTPGALIDLKWGSPHLTLTTQSSKYSGDGVLESQISFGDTTIDADAPVHSKLDLGISTAALTFDMVPGPVEVGLGLGVTYLSLDAMFVEDVTSEEVSTDESVPFPVLAARAGVDVGALEFGGLLTGLKVDVDGDKADFFDLDVYGRWTFLGGSNHLGGALVVGYRQSKVDVEYEDQGDQVSLDLTYSGPYFGLSIRF